MLDTVTRQERVALDEVRGRLVCRVNNVRAEWERTVSRLIPLGMIFQPIWIK